MRTSETDRTPSIGRQVYLSCGNASARPTNLPRSVSKSATNDALTAAAPSFEIASWARVDEGTVTKVSVASERVASVRRYDMGQLLCQKRLMGCSGVLDVGGVT